MITYKNYLINGYQKVQGSLPKYFLEIKFDVFCQDRSNFLLYTNVLDKLTEDNNCTYLLGGNRYNPLGEFRILSKEEKLKLFWMYT